MDKQKEVTFMMETEGSSSQLLASDSLNDGFEQSMRIAVDRIMNKLIPSYVTLDDEALALITNCTTEFLSSITCEALTNARLDLTNNATGENVLNSVRSLGYESYVKPLQTFMTKNEQHLEFCELCNQFSDTKNGSSMNGKNGNEKGQKGKRGRKRPLPQQTSSEDKVPSVDNIIPTSSSSVGAQVLPTVATPADGNGSTEVKKRRKGNKFDTQSASNDKSSQEIINKDGVEVAANGKRKGGRRSKNKDGNPSFGTMNSTTSIIPPIVTKQKEKQNKSNRKNWLDPEFIEEFRKKMEEGFEAADHTTFLKKLSKELNLSLKIVTTQFEV